MKEFLTPERIQKSLATGNLSRENAAELLISLIDGSDNIEIRVKSIETLEKTNIQSEKIFKILENYLISDENALVRASVANYIIHNYQEDGLSALRWGIQHETSPIVLSVFFDAMDKFDPPQLKSINTELIKWNEQFSSILGVFPQESKFFFDLEVLFANGERNYEIDPYSYKYFETLSDIKNGEPWLVIKDKHVEILNFNYFNWKFIKNNIDIVTSLSKLQDLDVYLCSIRKYSHIDAEIEKIPESIGSLIYLKKIILRRNGLKNLPFSLKNLSLLKELDVSYNNLKEIPQSISSLKALEKLNIKHNFVQHIPETLSNNTKVIR